MTGCFKDWFSWNIKPLFNIIPLMSTNCMPGILLGLEEIRGMKKVTSEQVIKKKSIRLVWDYKEGLQSWEWGWGVSDISPIYPSGHWKAKVDGDSFYWASKQKRQNRFYRILSLSLDIFNLRCLWWIRAQGTVQSWMKAFGTLERKSG